MSPTPSTIFTRAAEVQKVFQRRIASAFATALGGQTVIVIVPDYFPKQEVVNYIAREVCPEKYRGLLRSTPDSVYIDGMRGQIRIYPSNHITFDLKQKRLMDYPAGIPHFLHPEIEEFM